ncbi:MAG: cupin domain-containing protein [Burkholderiales bacterium]
MSADQPTAQAPKIPPIAQRPRIQFFRGSEATELFEANVMSLAPSPPERAPFNEDIAKVVPLGGESHVVFQMPETDGFSLVHAWFKSGFPLPAHTHDSDCLYYVLAGELTMGSHTLRRGDGFLVPANTAYAYVPGPQGVEVLEFRSKTRFDFRAQTATPQRWQQMVDTCRERQDAWTDEPRPTN